MTACILSTVLKHVVSRFFQLHLSSFPLLGGSWGGGRCSGFCEYRQFFRPIFPVVSIYFLLWSCYFSITLPEMTLVYLSYL